LVRALIALIPAGILLSGSLVRFSRGRTVGSYLQLIGSGCLLVVVLTHIFEALHWFPTMGWGLERSAGHSVDLASGTLGVALFPLGYLLDAFGRDGTAPQTPRAAESAPRGS
jgi:hypothetical protein